MNDEKALRLEQIKLDVRTNERLVDIQARWQVAAFAVGLTAAAGALAATLGGQLAAGPASVVAIGGGILGITPSSPEPVAQRAPGKPPDRKGSHRKLD